MNTCQSEAEQGRVLLFRKTRIDSSATGRTKTPSITRIPRTGFLILLSYESSGEPPATVIAIDLAFDPGAKPFVLCRIFGWHL